MYGFFGEKIGWTFFVAVLEELLKWKAAKPL